MSWRMPCRAWPLWLAGGVLWLTIAPPASSRGTSPGLLIDTVAALMVSPMVALLILPFLALYRAGGCAMFVWQARGWGPALLTLVSFGVTRVDEREQAT